MKECIFCKVVKGELPHHKVYEDKNFIAMLDAFPIVKGQTLIIPKKHSSYLFDINDKDYCDLMLVSKKIAKAIDKALKPIKTGLMVEGLEVDHIHIKLYPLRKPFVMAKLDETPSEDEMKKIAEKIKNSL